MQRFSPLIDKLKHLWQALKNHVVNTIRTAFPKAEQRFGFWTVLILAEFLLSYLIAMFDIGIWINNCSLPGMIAGYIVQRRMYPFAIFLLLSGGILACVYIFLQKTVSGNTGRGFSISDSNVYGSARDINLDELKQVADIVPKEQALGTILGQLDTTENRLITSKPVANFNNNLLVLAPPGSGKTFCIVQNSICQAIRRGESVITTDTKGELWAKTVEYARANGYTVRRFDLKNPRFSDGFDILAEMHNDDIRAKIAASIIMKNTGNEKDIHASAEEALLAAICMYQDLNDAIPPEEKTFYNAFAMLFSGAAALDNTFNSVKYDSKLRVAYDSYATFLQGSPNLRGNVITGLANRLSMLSSPAIRDMTSTPDIDLTLPGKKKCIYYCEMPDQHDAMRFLATLFFSFLLWDLTDFADSTMDQRLPIPVNVMIEEAYAVGELPTITNALSTVRSRGISITLIAQGISQFHILYGEEVTNTILNSCATFACLGSNTADTAELFSWMGGEATVKVKTERHAVGESPIKLGRSYSTGEGRQSLYTGNDIRKIPFGRIFLVWQRFDPIMAYTFGINRHPEFLRGKMPKILANTHIELSNKEARSFLRAHEEQRVQEFEEWLQAGGDPWAEYGTPLPDFNGPARNIPAPRIISYPELEEMALEHAKQAAVHKKDKLMKELQKQDIIPPEEGFEPPCVPEDFAWETIDIEDEDDCASAAKEEMLIDESEIPETEDDPIASSAVAHNLPPVSPESVIVANTVSPLSDNSEVLPETKKNTLRVQSAPEDPKDLTKQRRPRYSGNPGMEGSIVAGTFGSPGSARNRQLPKSSPFKVQHTLTRPTELEQTKPDSKQ